MENYVRLFHPNGFIKKVLGDGFCVIRAFQEGLICYNENHKLCDVKAALRSEILRNFDEYSAFSTDKVNVLTELDRFLAKPLQYYNSDTVDLFLIALGNSYVCNTIVYRCTEKDTWTTNINNPEKHYRETLYFAMTNKDHVDLVLNTDDHRVESERQDNRISSEADSDIEITEFVPPPKAFGKTVNNQPVKFAVQDNISSGDGSDRLSSWPSNSQSYSMQPNTCKLINLYNSFSSESEEDTSVVRSESAKLYVKESYWGKTPVKHVKQFSYDIDGRGIFNVPFNPEKRFESSRDGRPWTNVIRSRQGGFKGDRFIAQCKGSFQCSNPHCPDVVQYNRFNRRQFTPKGMCKSCGNLCERQKCDARKIFEFPEEKSIHIVTIKYFGTHLCSPIKPKGKRDIKEIIASNLNKASKAKRDILYTMICEGAKFEDIEGKASQLMDRKILNKIQASENPPEFAQLINVRER